MCGRPLFFAPQTLAGRAGIKNRRHFNQGFNIPTRPNTPDPNFSLSLFLLAVGLQVKLAKTTFCRPGRVMGASVGWLAG